MSMLTLSGTLDNVYDTPAKTDKKSGEIYAASTRIQILARNTLENGQQRTELVTLKVKDASPYRGKEGKPVKVPVGVFVAGGALQFYALNEVAA